MNVSQWWNENWQGKLREVMFYQCYFVHYKSGEKPADNRMSVLSAYDVSLFLLSILIGFYLGYRDNFKMQL